MFPKDPYSPQVTEHRSTLARPVKSRYGINYIQHLISVARQVTLPVRVEIECETPRLYSGRSLPHSQIVTTRVIHSPRPPKPRVTGHPNHRHPKPGHTATPKSFLNLCCEELQPRETGSATLNTNSYPRARIPALISRKCDDMKCNWLKRTPKVDHSVANTAQARRT